jgi:hypothetical protein
LHYNQIIEVRGSLSFEGGTHIFGSTGVGDHTRGPRQVSKTDGHQFVFRTFPSGRNMPADISSSTVMRA